jgi:hypothetical protein
VFGPLHQSLQAKFTILKERIPTLGIRITVEQVRSDRDFEREDSIKWENRSSKSQ